VPWGLTTGNPVEFTPFALRFRCVAVIAPETDSSKISELEEVFEVLIVIVP
jgi:hypothetical protein